MRGVFANGRTPAGNIHHRSLSSGLPLSSLAMGSFSQGVTNENTSGKCGRTDERF